MTDNLISSPFLYHLSLTLIHFIWQGFFVALALKLLLTFTSYKKPQWRYAFASLAMVANLLLPLLTFFIIYQPDFQQFSPLLSNNVLLNDVINNEAINNGVWYANIIDFLPYISLIWLVITFALAAKLFIELYNVNQLPKSGVSPADPALEAHFYQLVKQVKLTCSPRILISLKNDVPMAIGWLKPVVLIPVSMLSGLTPAQLDMLILHELAHIKRHDYLVNFVQTLVEIFLFFHPCVRWVSKQMRNEREYCSDDIAVQHCGNPVAYAHTLADTATLCAKHRHHSIPAMAMAASGGDLKQRVVRLIDQEHHCSTDNNSGKWLASIAILFSIVVVGSKQFIQLPILDLNSGTISLYRNSNDNFKVSNDNAEDVALPSFAQQLLHKDNDSSYLMNKLPENLLLTNQLNVSGSKHNSEPVALADTKSATISSISTETKNTSNQISHHLENNEVTTTKRIAKEQTVTKPIIKQTSAEFVDSYARTNNETVSTNNLQIVKSSLPASTLNNGATVEKSMSEIAFERTDSTRSNAKLVNPYAQQVANLASEPVKTHLQLNLPPAVNSLNIEQTLSKATQAADNIIPVHFPAKLLKSVNPKYPSNAKRKGIETDIQVTFTIDTNGYIRDIQYNGKGKISYFRNSIRSSLEKWRFAPARYNDQAIESTMSKIFSFSIAK